MSDIHAAVSALNAALQLDSRAIERLIEKQTSCWRPLLDHPTIQVNEREGVVSPDYSVSVLSLLNGVLEEMTGQRVSAVYDEGGRLVSFTAHAPIE